MKLLVDYDDQYMIQRVADPMFVFPPLHKWSLDNGCVQKPPVKMPPQMMRLIDILEREFLGRWAYVKEYREVLREIDLGVKNTLQQRVFRQGKAEQARVRAMWKAAQDEFIGQFGSAGALTHTEFYLEDNAGRVSMAPDPTYYGTASDTGSSAYALFRRRRTVLVRAGILRIKRAVKRRVGELLGRPLLPEEGVVEGKKSELLHAQIRCALAQGAFGGVIEQLNFLNNPNWALFVAQDTEVFRPLIHSMGLHIITDKSGCRDYVEEEV